jgi:hypothetical protein
MMRDLKRLSVRQSYLTTAEVHFGYACDSGVIVLRNIRFVTFQDSQY